MSEEAEAIRTPLTHAEFLTLMKKGWETLEWNSGFFYKDEKGSPLSGYAILSPDFQPVSACAIGAAHFAAVGLSMPVYDWANYRIGTGNWLRITDASNKAGSKEAAIKAVSEIQWVV